ncbi:MAG: arsenate reductase ArsC [Armatimonadetes bacterium]|nr:arsenate reductase ArsC [Anaerolineae bacterium]
MPRRVLILCTGNSARSQMAEALINAQRTDQWHAVSAGTQPAPHVNPYALRALAEIGIQTAGSRPKHIDEFTGQPFDLVITVCDDAAENCPVWFGQGQRQHISFPDPAKASGMDDDILAAFREVRDGITERVLSALDAFAAHAN